MTNSDSISDEYVVLEWSDNEGCYYPDFESDGIIHTLTLEVAKERKKNLEASKEFDRDNNEIHIFKLVQTL